MFRNLEIRWKLTALLVLPLVGLIVFASFQLHASAARQAQADRLNRLSGLAVDLSGLTDALQQERATSSGYMASGRRRYLADMASDRRVTDRAARSLRSRVGTLPLADYSPRLQTDLNDAVRRLGELRDWRRSMDTTSPAVTRVVNFYGELLDSLLAVIAAIGVEPGSEGFAASVAALVEISRAKEAASQSTSLLLTALIQREFGAGEYQRFASLVGAEDSSVQRFLAAALREERTFYQHAVAGSDNSSLAEVMRQAALASPVPPAGLDADTWLEVMSTKVAQLHSVELRVAADVATASAAARAAARRQATTTIVAAIVVVPLAIGLALLLARSMARPLEKLEQAARDLVDRHLPGVAARLQHAGLDLDPTTRTGELSLEALSKSAPRVPVASRDETGRLAEAFNTVQRVAIRIAAEQVALRRSVGGIFLNLARRTQLLVSRQLELIDQLEREQEDPAALQDLFKLDHLAIRMRRNAEDLIVLSGAEPARRWSGPIPLPDVVRAAIGEVEDYGRVELLRIAEIGVVGHVVADVVHLLAELIENATSLSPPNTNVQIAGSAAASGYVLEIEDRGLGMSDSELIHANERIADPPAVDFSPSPLLGLQVVGRLGQRHGIKVQLRHSWYGGVTALVLLPAAITVDFPSSQDTPIVLDHPEHPLPASADPLTGARRPLFEQIRPGWSATGVDAGQPPAADRAAGIGAEQAPAFEDQATPQPAAPPRPPAPSSEWEALSGYRIGLQHGGLTGGNPATADTTAPMTTRRGDAQQ
jgi:Nitrate and nitrite sensing/HAMP domain